MPPPLRSAPPRSSVRFHGVPRKSAGARGAFFPASARGAGRPGENTARRASPFVPSRVVFLALCLFALSGCAGRFLPEDSAPRAQPRLAHMRDVNDLRNFPQDLTVYAKALGERKTLLPEAEQTRQAVRFERIFFGPWKRDMAPAPLADLASRFGNGPKGFAENAQKWSKQDWEMLRANADLASYPSLGRPGITLRRTLMRELPTARARMAEARPAGPDNPFDMFQYSALPLGTPLYIAHRSADEGWYFVQTPVASGWISAADAAPVDAAFAEAYRSGRYAAIIRDDVPASSKAGSSGKVHVGEIYPLRAAGSKKLTLLIPVRNTRGEAAPAEAEFSSAQARPWPLPLNPAWMAAVGNQMMGQPYGWGGLYDGRDCSSSLRDLFTPFGIWLPRNSAAQARVGHYASLDGLEPSEKERVIAARAAPFMSLMWMRGHIMLYLGQYKNRSAVFHNVWGLRVREDGNDDARHVIGRGVVSSLRPGLELPMLKEGTMLSERLLGIATLPPK